jgi:hypothetical protein
MRVFVNYRTGDGETTAALIEQFLSRRLGTENVFRASKSIRPGTVFDRALLKNVWRSDVLLAVIGKNWLDARDQQGRALDNEDDWVRREIVGAFDHDVQVIPVLVGRIDRLRAEDLPASLAELARLQSVRFDVRAAESGLRDLASALGAAAGQPAPKRRKKGGGQRGGIGSISGHNVTAVTDARGPVHIGDRQESGEDR